MQKLLIGLLCASLLVFLGCGGKKTEMAADNKAETEQTDPHAGHDHGDGGGEQAMTSTMTKATGDTVRSDTGLKYIIMQAGEGDSPKPGDQVRVHYTGWLLSNGQKFDSSVDRGRPFPFIIGQGKVIKGWDEGVMSMKIGEKRQLIIPPELGYGERGAGAIIPPGATLVFDVELLGIGAES